MNLIEIFRRLDESEKNPILFWSQTEEGWMRRLAWNPVAEFSGLQDELPTFVKAQEGRLIAGYLAYDEGDLAFPQARFFAYESWLEEDSELTEVVQKILMRPPRGAAYDLDLKPSMSHEAYKAAFKRVQDYIKAGHIYQMNLTLRFESETQQDPKSIFLYLMEHNPVNFMAYLEVDEDRQILSASPERFIHTKGKAIHTYPIKGTRPRGRTPEEDEAQRHALLDSEKEAAELNMITDLLRNDVGRVAEIGSVQVRAHREARAYPSIWHTYSHIEGRLAVSPVEALLSMFPGGSITGCPKIRAMEIIAELEPHPRGVYTGSIGFIEPSGDLDFNIAIRTVLKHKNRATLQVGGGLVYDSDLESEWEEIFNKARPFMPGHKTTRER